MREDRRILLTGATGYVGGKLLRKLEQTGQKINCLARDPSKIQSKASKTFVFQGDVLERSSMWAAFQGVDTAYYLVHSLGDKNDFEAHEMEAAANFASMARGAGVRRIIYLGGLGNESDGLSPHLRSRQDVGRVLRNSGVPTLELRASIVLGAGSLSFEMIRALTEHLPFMVTPKWVSVQAQPIGIRDLLDYLVRALEVELPASRVVEIGGADQVSYRDLMVEYARQRGLRRMMIPIPLLTPWLSSHWLGLVTPLYAAVGRKLIASIRNSTVVEHPESADFFNITPCGMTEAISQALAEEALEFKEPSWLDSIAARMQGTGHRVFHDKNRLIDYRCSTASTSPLTLFHVVSSIGGDNGMFSCNGLWRVREWADRCLGGRNLRRRRGSELPLTVGEKLDFFQVEIVEQDRRIRLKTQMKLPGEAWLEFKVEHSPEGNMFHHAVIYEPKGFMGLVYWHLTYPIHALVFHGMHKAILREGIRQEYDAAAAMITA
ncbi:DUF2867 domain-containing protein [Pontiella sulfatireligans]|uniref:NAD(P)-binding domain-containing protein n=1 Tax=Pontiella sulfatireligans TaxID=2750658 RepID=A0A6C2UMK1_9BACT|nr:DUF2867 domain-containing protein [Pontiella sulfatireligans]VGO21153.1 hypothetical protein SCARR_03224 [Pontiella sulfatireligans]